MVKSCKICESTFLEEYGKIDSLMYVKCKECQFIFEPSKIDDADNLNEFYANFILDKDSEIKDIIYEFELRRIKKYKKGGLFLDFGGGIGGFAKKAD